MGGNNNIDPNQAAAANMAAFAQYGPAVSQTLGNWFMPLAGNAARINTDAYIQNAPRLNRVTSQINRQNALNQQITDNRLVSSPAARNIIDTTTRLQERADPQWAHQRRSLSSSLDNLPQQQLLPETGSGLSGSETAEMSRNMARYQGGRGNLPGTGGAITGIENAMAFGEAGHNRLMANRSENRTTAAFKPTMINQALPNLRSGMDPFKMLTGRSGSAQGVDTGNPYASQGSNVFGGFGNIMTAANTSNAQQPSLLEQLPSYS